MVLLHAGKQWNYELRFSKTTIEVIIFISDFKTLFFIYYNLLIMNKIKFRHNLLGHLYWSRSSPVCMRIWFPRSFVLGFTGGFMIVYLVNDNICNEQVIVWNKICWNLVKLILGLFFFVELFPQCVLSDAVFVRRLLFSFWVTVEPQYYDSAWNETHAVTTIFSSPGTL